MSIRSARVWKCIAMAVAAAALVAIPMGLSRSPVAMGAEESAALAELQQISKGFVEIAQSASPAVVHIQVEKEMTAQQMPFGGPGMGPDGFEDFFRRFFGPGGPRQQLPQQRRSPQGPPSGPVPYGQGSGFIISDDGYIATNNHVVAGADVVRVTLNDGREFEAETIGTDPQTEIALLKVDATGLPALPLGDSDDLRVGEWVVAIGSPFGLEHTVTSGIVSAKGRGNVGIVDYADFIQTDAAINPGNSGGPLLNLNGEVVGMNTAILSRSGGYMGIGLAIPVNMIKYVEKQIRDHGSVERGYFGVMLQELTPGIAENLGLESGKGVLIAQVEPGSPADQGGLKQGDVIVEYEGQPATEVRTLVSRVANTAPSTEVSVEILRDGSRQTKTLVLGSRPENIDMQGRPRTGEATETGIGLSVQELTDELAEGLGYEEETGVLIAQVEPGSPAARAGLEEGMLIKEVNRTPVTTLDEFQSELEKAEGKKTVLMLVQTPEGYARFYAVELSQ